MFWSKLWLLLITLFAGLAAAVALLAPRPLDRDLEHEAGARLTQAQQSATQLLKINARRWMDTAGQMAADAVLIESLEQASSSRGPADLTLVHRTVQERLRDFNAKMKTNLVMIATDARGRVIARAGLEEGEYKDGIEGFPVVADALRGLRGDDTWSLGGKLYRVAASPVIGRDKYVGALLVGQEVGSELAQSMKQVLEVDVAFLLRGRVLASSTQSPVVQKLSLLPPFSDDKQLADMQRVGHTPPLLVDAEGGPYLVVLAPFVGEAAGHKATFALLLPRPGALPIGTLLRNLIQPAELNTMPWMALAPVGGGVLIALVLGLLLMRLETERPLKRMAREAQALARGELQRLDDDKHPGKLGTVARAVNTTLDRLAATRGPQPAARNPEVVLRPASQITLTGPTSHGPGSSEPPLRPPTPKTTLPPSPPPPSRFPTPSPSPTPSRSPLPSPPPSMAAPPSRFGERSEPSVGLPGGANAGPSRARPTMDLREPTHSTRELRAPARKSVDDFAPPPSSETSAPDALTSPKMQLQPLTDTDDALTAIKLPDDGPDTVDGPSLLSPLSSSAIPTQPAHPSLRGFDDEPTAAGAGAGEIAKIVEQERKIAEQEQAQPKATPTPAEKELETELQQVYHDFIETKQRLGEPTEGVTFDKFVVKLRANRQQLITRYHCKKVKFQVYVKDGKAALKATPVTA